jgi:hypothetical protein
MAAMVILQLPTEPVVGGTEDCSVRLGSCSSNRAIRKQLVVDELVKRWKEERKNMRKRGSRGLDFAFTELIDVVVQRAIGLVVRFNPDFVYYHLILYRALSIGKLNPILKTSIEISRKKFAQKMYLNSITELQDTELLQNKKIKKNVPKIYVF